MFGNIMESINVNQKSYKIIKLLGKGKGGYSYLVSDENNNEFVVKQIHHEPCSYYNFSNKLESEINDYHRLLNIGINLPKLYEIDYQNERILKEYIDGKTIDYYVKNDLMKQDYINQVKKMCEVLYKNNLNVTKTQVSKNETWWFIIIISDDGTVNAYNKTLDTRYQLKLES